MRIVKGDVLPTSGGAHDSAAAIDTNGRSPARLSFAKTVAGRRRWLPSGCRDDHELPEAKRATLARSLRGDTEPDVEIESTVDRARQAAVVRSGAISTHRHSGISRASS